MKKIWKLIIKYLKSDSDDSIASLYKFVGYLIVAVQIFLWSQACWLSLIETVFFFLILFIYEIFCFRFQI